MAAAVIATLLTRAITDAEAVAIKAVETILASATISAAAVTTAGFSSALRMAEALTVLATVVDSPGTGGEVVVVEATVNGIAEVVGTDIAVIAVLDVTTAANEVLTSVSDGADVAVAAGIAIGLGGFAFPGEGVACRVIARVLVAIRALHVSGSTEPLDAGAPHGAGVAVVAAGPVNGLMVAFPLLPLHGAEVDGAVVVVIAIKVDPGGVAAVGGVPILAGIEVSAVGIVLVKTLPFRGPTPLVCGLLLDETAALVSVTSDPRQKAIKGGFSKLFEALLLALLKPTAAGPESFLS